MKKSLVLLVGALLLSNGALAATDGCAAARKPVAACHAVHGRLSTYNGRWSAVIWVIGTKHRLGVLGMLDDNNEENMLLPDNVVFGPDDEVYGDFTVCPLVPPHKGQVEEVCVKSAKHLRVKSRG